jgi:polysaccharide export outer membrane protein
MKRTFDSLLLAIALFAASGVQAQTAASTEGLNPGDQIRIVVWRNVELSGDFTIAANGTITHPLYREVQVTGLPLSAVEDRLRTFLTRYTTNPQFVILPLVKVIVGGEVRTPNVFSVPPETTIAQVVVMAGGPTERGAVDHIRLLRGGQEITVDLSRPDADAASVQIRSGDQILIPRKSSYFRDYVGPVASLIGALTTIFGILTR